MHIKRLQACLSFPNRKTVLRILFYTLAFLLFAHAYRYFSLSFSGESLMIDQSSSRSIQMAAGRFLQPVYWRLRGDLAAPLLIGMLSWVFLACSALVVVWSLRLRDPLCIFAVCGVLAAGSSVTALNAFSIQLADAFLFADLLMLFGAALCMRLRFGFIAAPLFFFAGLGLNPSCVSAAAAMLLLLLWVQLLEGTPFLQAIRRLLLSAAALLTGCAMYAAAAFLTGHALPFSPQLDGALFQQVLNRAFQPVFAFLHSYTYHAGAVKALSSLLLLLALPALAVRLRKDVSLIKQLLLPVLAFPFTLSSAYAAVFIPLFLLLIFDHAASVCPLLGIPSQRIMKCCRGLIAFAFAFIFLSSFIFSNQVYLRKDLEFQSTLSVMTRVIDRAEQTEGYVPAQTPVAIIGHPGEANLSASRPGFTHLDGFFSEYDTAASESDNTWYFWEILGYPFNFVSEYERQMLKTSPMLEEMPAFPAEGACRMIDGVLVIRLS